MANSKKSRKVHEIIYISYEFRDDFNSDLYKIITMLNMSRILESISIEETIGGFLSLYALMNPSILEIEEYVSELMKESVILKKIEIRSEEDIIKYINYVDLESNEYLLKHLNLNVKNSQGETLIYIRPMSEIFKEKFKSLNFKASSIVAYVGQCLVLLVKKLDKFNHSSWVKNKWNSFLRTVGENICSEFGPAEILFPRLKLCKDVYTFFSKHKSFRRVLFVGIMKLSTQNGIWSNVCRTVLKLSKAAEMNNIYLINTYILQDHPEIISINELKYELLQLQSAFEIFKNSCLPKEHWPYLKILYLPLKDEFDKQNFPLLTYIATQIGMKTQPSLFHFTTSIPPEKENVAKKILKFIYKEDSLSCYKRLKSERKIKKANITDRNSKDISMFSELLNLSDSLEQSLYQSLGINSFHEKDLNIDCVANALPTTKITYIKLSENFNCKIFELVSLVSILKVYENDSIENVIGSIFTLMANTDFKLLTDELKTALKNHGYQLVEILIESSAELPLYLKFENEELNKKLFHYCGSINKSCCMSSTKIIKTSVEFEKLLEQDTEISIPVILIFIGLYLTFMFKQLTDENYLNWVDNKITTFARVLENKFPNSNYDKILCVEFVNSLKPTLAVSQAIYSFFSTNFMLRKLIFFQIWNITESTEILDWICLVVGQIAKATEMNHIFLINNFIIMNKSFLMKMKELRPELKRFLSALETIPNKATEEKYWPFLKIILHPADTEFLNKNHFPLLTFMAGGYNNSKHRKYKSGKLSTHYIEQIVQIANGFKESFDDDLNTKENFYFRLNAQNDDLLSTISDEHLKNLYVISQILSLCSKETFCFVSQEKIDNLKNLSAVKAKENISAKLDTSCWFMSNIFFYI